MNQIQVFTPSQGLMEMEKQCREVAGIDMGIARIFARATKVAAIKSMMAQPEMMKVIVALAGNPAGFFIGKGDEDIIKSPAALASVVTEALSRGARLDGGEFTVLKGRAFLNKGYYHRQLDELGHDESYTEGCRYRMLWWDRRETRVNQTGSTVEIGTEITYKLLDKKTNLEMDVKKEEFLCWIRTFSSDTPDKWVGQAERRAFQKLLRKLSSTDFGDEDEGDVQSEQVLPQLGKASLSNKKATTTQQPHPDVEDAVVIDKPEEIKEAIAGDVKDAIHNLHGVAESKAGPARTEIPPLRQFQETWTAAKAVVGLDRLKRFMKAMGWEGKLPSSIPDDKLLMLTSKLKLMLNEKPLEEPASPTQEPKAKQAQPLDQAATQAAMPLTPPPPKPGALF